MTKHWLVMEPDGQGAPAPYVARVAGAGRYLPETRLTTDELMATTRHHTHIDLERLTGIRERRVAAGDQDSYTLAVSAALNCLATAQQDPASLDVVIRLQHHQVPGRPHPMAGTDHEWCDRPRDRRARRDDLRRVQRVCRNAHRRNDSEQLDPPGVVERGLVVSGEYISQLSDNAARHIRNIMSKELACLTLGDAGAALLLERAPAGSAGIALAGFTTVADYSRLCLAYPQGHDPGARMFTNSRGIQQAAIANTPLLLHEVLDAVGISVHDIDHVITHQTSARAIRKGMTRLTEEFGDSPRHDAVITVDRYGNTASTTHTVALVEELEAGHIAAGERIALLALASGLEIGVVLVTLDEDLVKRYGHSH